MGRVLSLFFLLSLFPCLTADSIPPQLRRVLTEPTGEISDGDQEYPSFARCEWLIDARNGSKYIQLEFHHLYTECSYDFLFIFDGHSYNSPILASLSGQHEPKPVIARSGQMLIYLFSDRNYVKQGFRATYTIQDCLYNCSGNGRCVNNVCVCDSRYRGEGCEEPICPNDCGQHGHCVGEGTNRRCQCDQGYTGYMCNISLNDSLGGDQWYTVARSNTGFSARSAHGGVFIHETNCLYVFGGFTLNEILGDVVMYCMNENRWQTLPVSEPWPEGRYEHAMAGYKDGFYMYGGILQRGEFSDNLWYFNATLTRWQLAAVNSSVRPLKLSGHSLTVVDDDLYLFGGKTQDGRFWSDIYKINAQEPEEWTEVSVMGGKSTDRRLVGHSAVFHMESRSLLIYAGYTHSSDQPRFGTHTDKLHAFHVDQRVWSEIHYEKNRETDPKQRSFHSAVIMGNFMVVYGGNTHIHHDNELCYDYEMYLYHLACHTWVQARYVMSKTKDVTIPKDKQGRVSHIAAVVNGNILLIAGGYAGYVLGDLIAFKFPNFIAPPQSELGMNIDYCEDFPNLHRCGYNPECFYCANITATNTKGCIHRTRTSQCGERTNLLTTKKCLGICWALDSCQDCTSQGQGATLGKDSPKLRMYIQPCSWCVKEAQCQTRDEPKGTCFHPMETESKLVGWWDGLSASLNNLSQCPAQDLPAGLQSIKYRSPQNFDHPDEVLIIRQTYEVEKFRRLYVKHSNQDEVQWKGFIHPLNATTKLVYNDSIIYSMKLSVENITVILYLSRNESRDTKEMLQKTSSNRHLPIEFEHRKDKVSPIFSDVGRGKKYYFTMSGTYTYPAHTEEKSIDSSIYKVELQWNGISPNSSNLPSYHFFSSEFLQPYQGGNCSLLTNCLACMTDSGCGWCDIESRCLARNVTENSSCMGEDKGQILITTPSHCSVCPDHVECATCAEDPLCEWVTEHTSCIRRGRMDSNQVVQNSSMCPNVCHGHNSCSGCLMIRGCAWCENLRTCLPFADYVLRHRHGQCTEWIDNEEANKNPYSCRNCSAKSSCETCLKTFSCGWCGNTDNPTIGVCGEGDFSGPYSQVNCSALVTSRHPNISVTEDADWSYSTCPDVEECRLGLAGCHTNATCVNTPTSYNCTCNRGFFGNGFDECEETCYHTCYNGVCMDEDGEFFCDCDLGWTGDNCSVNCGCNGHSMCTEGVGKCDFCDNGTTGQFCDRCLPGFFGDPTKPDGCYPCECHGHGDIAQGLCHNETGVCFCVDNTEEFQCQKCKDGFYGDPRDGGQCYLNCDHGMILENITSGALGSYQGPGVSTWQAYCLWILTVSTDIKDPWLLEELRAPITFSLEDLAVECERDHVYVYDGIPSFIDEKGKGKLLGAFCGFYQREFQAVTAQSGVLTVYFRADRSGNFSSTVGFNAAYSVDRCFHCPDYENKMCMGGVCLCKPGYHRPDCSSKICPDHCTYRPESSSCHCESGYGAATFSISTYPWDFNQVPIAMEMGGSGPISRYGHTFIRCDDELGYLFGGRSLQHGLLNDIWQYNFNTYTWTEIQPFNNIMPSGRYYHAAACVPIKKILYVFGGLTEVKDSQQYKASKEMWHFAIDAKKWTGPKEPNWVKGLAGHSMTLVEGTKLVIIGGFSQEKYFSDTVYEFDANSYLTAWQTHTRNNVTGPKPIGLYGHSAVYHEKSNSIYIYGGHIYKDGRLYVSRNLFVYDVPTKAWNILQPEPRSKLDERYFHVAVGFDNYMLIVGGYTHHRNFSTDILIYRYACNFWHSFSLADTEAGRHLTSTVGSAAVTYNGSLYLIGGFDNVLEDTVYQLTLPNDICSLTHDLNVCLLQPGCSACIKRGQNGANITVCYSTNNRPADCQTPPDQIGQQCNFKWHTERDCSRIKNCSECVAVYPQFKSADTSCVWCKDCKNDRCVPRAHLTERQRTNNKTDHNMLTRPVQCDLYMCEASTCDRCVELGCMWTRHFQNIRSKTGEIYRKPSLTPVYDWSCVYGNLRNQIVGYDTNSDNICPVPCYAQYTCQDCLKSLGSEGGSQECYWSVSLQECFAPAYLPLHCVGGKCGTVLQGWASKCPQPCSVNTKCADCRKSPGCGWCAFRGLNGLGVCMEGTLSGPLRGQCRTDNVTFGSKPLRGKDYQNFLESDSPPSWAYATCPPEDECSNFHHNCDTNTQNCKDALNGFSCECKQGYVLKDEGEMCKPVCHQECEHGECIRPDHCQCHFGWVGTNCSTKCLCNEHSNCKSVQERHICLHCMNNTQGRQCDECQPLHVGDPKNGGRCQSCTEFCNNHTDICLQRAQYNSSYPAIQRILLQFNNTKSPQFKHAISQVLDKGLKPEENPYCVDCEHNTENNRCQECESGYFRLDKASKTQPCMPCMCNGHSDICDKDGGLRCQCHNNSETRCNPDGKDKLSECHTIQCAFCKEYFVGTPTEGHQCYRQMVVNREYCFDPITQQECNRNPTSLSQGRTVFFAVQPKYVNVDIRVTIDVTQGGMDVYFSFKDNTFIVDTDRSSGIHTVRFDPKLRFITDNRKKRSVSQMEVNNSEIGEKFFVLNEMEANDLNTFITVDSPGTILVIRKVRCRLVVTLPNDSLDLRTSRFYIIFSSTGDDAVNQTTGSLYFRQDQPHIDLFVFFSVFFSCFFLFLAMCVLLWKTKQAFDARQSRQQRAREMQHMASRPFAKVLVLVNHPTSLSVSPKLWTGRVTDRTPLLPSETCLPPSPVVVRDSLDLIPIAIEPTDDGVAAIGTVVLQLPGGSLAPTRLCLGSALTMRSQLVHSATKLRRRPSSSAC